jgi:hypothetical protein
MTKKLKIDYANYAIYAVIAIVIIIALALVLSNPDRPIG